MTSLNARPVAIVTAASRGMGAACARRLSRDGYDLVLMSSSDGCETLAQELGGTAVVGSVTDVQALESVVDRAMTTYGRIDAVVNNTGHPPKGALLEISDDDWHVGLDLVVLNVVRMARLVTPQMAAQGGGAIVNISATGAIEPSSMFPVSSSLRAGLSAFTKLYASTHAADGIRMNSVLPGFIDSYPEHAEIVADIPVGRYGSVDEIAGTVAFLLSDDAGYITGRNLAVDGGLLRST